MSRRTLAKSRHTAHHVSPASDACPDGLSDHEPMNEIRQRLRQVGGWALTAVDRMSHSQWLQRALPVLLFVVALGLFVPRLDYPEKYLFDEILFAYTAGEYTEGNADAFYWDHPCSVFKSDSGCVEAYPDALQVDRVGKYQWDHPPLGKHIISLGILLFGNDSFGWRISSSVFGAIGAVLAYHLGVKLTGRRAVGVLTAALLMVDGLYFVYSRMGLVDIFVTVLMLGAVLMFAEYLLAPPHRVRWPLFATGVLLGLGIGTKWNAGYLAALVGLVVLGRLVRLLQLHWRGNTSPETRRGIVEHMIWAPLALCVVTLAIYILAFTQFFLEGYSVEQFIELQKQTFHVHSTIRDGNSMASRWWEWPLALRHVWFGNRSFDDGRIATTYALGNPLLYWAFLPAIAWLCVRWWQQRHPGLIIIIIGFFGQWLPWLFVERSTYTYHFLPAVPFGCLAVALAISHLFHRYPGWRRTLAVEYVVLVALAFAFFYPMFSFLPISEEALALRMWLPSWR